MVRHYYIRHDSIRHDDFRPYKFAGALLLTAIISPNVFAFAALGHQLVCDIAWREMAVNTQRSIIMLLKQTEYKKFANACTWADSIRDKPNYRLVKPQHFVNISRKTTHISGPQGNAGNSILQAIPHYIDILLGRPIQQEGYPNTPAQALLLVGHFVGDIHQPLHVSYADDMGGNRLAVVFNGETTNLHRIWDLDLVLPTATNDPIGWKTLGEQLFVTITKQDKAEWAAIDVTTWANESLSITRAIYEHLPDNRYLDNAYYKQYHPIIIRRIKMAGIRLAILLDTVFSGSVETR